MPIENTPTTPVRRRLRRGLATVGTASLAVALAACAASGSDAGSTSGSRDSSLIIAENEPPASFDPIQADNSTVDEVDLPAYDTLVKYNNSNSIVGDLATSWSASADGKTYTIKIRSGVTFHNGAKLTATDVKYTLDRDKKIGIDADTFIAPYASSTVDSPTEITIHLSQAYTPFMGALTRIYIVNSKLVQQHAGSDEGQSWLSDHDAGSGPYELVSYTPNEQADFKQYKNYWGGWDGQAKTVVFKYYSDGAEEASALNDGDVDLAMDIDPSDWASYMKNPKYVVNEAKTNVVLYVFFKMQGAITSNKYLREAVAYSYDYQEHVSDILKGAGNKVTGVLPSGMECSTTIDVTQPTYDLAAAKAALAKSGLKNVTLTMTYLKATSEMEQAATLLQSGLAKIGVTLNLDAVTFPTYATMEDKAATTPELGMIYAFPAYDDPDAIMYQNFDSKFILGGEDYGLYVNKTVDSLVEKAQEVSDAAQRCSLYDQAQSIVTSDYATVNMANSDYVVVYNSRLKGYKYEAGHHQTVDVYRIKVSS